MIENICKRLAFIVFISPFFLIFLLLAGCADGSYATSDIKDTQASGQNQLASEQLGPALRLARASRAAGDFASSINLYRGVTAVKPTDPALMVEFGDTLVEAGSIDDAIDTYNQVPEKSNSRVGALLGLERAYFALAEPTKALACMDQALALAPQDEKVLIGRGVALDILNRHEEAQASYRSVIAVTPHNLAARNNLALSLALSGKFAEASDIMTAIARSTTSTPRTRQNMALIYGLMGDGKQAEDLSRVDLSPTETAANLRFFDLVRSASNQ